MHQSAQIVQETFLQDCSARFDLDPIWVKCSHARRESAGLRGRSAGFVGGEWCPCWAGRLGSTDAAGPAKDSLMRDTWKTVWPSLLTQHTHSMMIHSEVLLRTTRYKIYQLIRCERTQSRSSFCHVPEPSGSKCASFPATRQQRYIIWVQKRWSSQLSWKCNCFSVSWCHCVWGNETLTRDSTRAVVDASGLSGGPGKLI